MYIHFEGSVFFMIEKSPWLHLTRQFVFTESIMLFYLDNYCRQKILLSKQFFLSQTEWIIFFLFML